MKKRLFTDSDVTPTQALLRKQLGPAMDFYTEVLATSGTYRKQWQFNRGNGWILKVDDMRKALYYLIAFEEGIEISLTVRDAERAAFLGAKAFEKLYPQLMNATPYPEGHALRFEIEGTEACRSVCRFLEHLITMRTAPRKSKTVSKL